MQAQLAIRSKKCGCPKLNQVTETDEARSTAVRAPASEPHNLVTAGATDKYSLPSWARGMRRRQQIDGSGSQYPLALELRGEDRYL